MNEDAYNKRVERIQSINDVIKDLEPEIRESAFDLLKDFATEPGSQSQAMQNTSKSSSSAPDRERFFTSHTQDKPFKNVYLIAAWHYSLYGTEPITRPEIEQLAGDIGLTIPNRPDKTLRTASKDKKSLFQTAGTGGYKPTVHGESFLKEEYGVTKGTREKIAPEK